MLEISLLCYIKVLRDDILKKTKADLGIITGNFDQAEPRAHCTFAGITVLKTRFYT